MHKNVASKLISGSIIAIAAATLSLATPVLAQQTGGQGNQGSGSQHGGGSEQHGQAGGQHGDQGGSGSSGQGSGAGASQGGTAQGGAEGGSDAASGSGEGASGQQTTAPGGGRGGKGMDDIMRDIEGDEDSDRPDYAGLKGGPEDKGGQPDSSGTKKGDLFGDLYVILRDEDGVPILTPEGFVQPVDLNGDPIPLDEEGAPIDVSLAIPVELGRLNAGRSPTQVLDSRAAEVVTLLNSALLISLDPAGRLLVTTEFVVLRDEEGNPILNEDGQVQPIDADGNVIPLDNDGMPIDPDLAIPAVQKTIDAPLENLAIYVALLTTGSIPNVNDLPYDDFDALTDGRLTVEDLILAAPFLAAASDKSDTLTLDEIAYINAFLGISTVTEGNVTYSDVDYSRFEYDREDTYKDVTADVLQLQPDGSWVEVTVNVYVEVFGSTDYEGEDFEGFVQAAEDARAVIEYIHEYAIPAS